MFRYEVVKNGEIVSARNSKRIYTHAIIVFQDGMVLASHYCSSYELAVKNPDKKKWEEGVYHVDDHGSVPSVEILPVRVAS